jgi:uncharacterized membrane protein
VVLTVFFLATIFDPRFRRGFDRLPSRMFMVKMRFSRAVETLNFESRGIFTTWSSWAWFLGRNSVSNLNWRWKLNFPNGGQ